MVAMLEFNAKMSSFSITRKKTPFQKHREEEEAKEKGEKSKDGVSVPKKGSRYVPSFIPPPMASKGKEPERKREEERPKEKEKGKGSKHRSFYGGAEAWSMR
ncbi:hypothetical protein NC652_018012 [Populus alba x Populus x berolinensis]|nr:hypothetical protein NC652_018012 [Populus alba x Populus x berolinensis]